MKLAYRFFLLSPLPPEYLSWCSFSGNVGVPLRAYTRSLWIIFSIARCYQYCEFTMWGWQIVTGPVNCAHGTRVSINSYLFALVFGYRIGDDYLFFFICVVVLLRTTYLNSDDIEMTKHYLKRWRFTTGTKTIDVIAALNVIAYLKMK